MKSILAVMLAVALAASPALARNFTGARAEVRLGVDVAGSDLAESYDYDDGFYRLIGERSVHVADAGFNYGLGVGYDFAVGPRVVAGVEATLDFSTAENCLGDFHQWEDFCVEAGRDIGLGVRAGAIVASNALLYVKAGYANGRIKMTGREVFWPSKPMSESKNREGLRVGAGLETALSRTLFLKVEYTYTDYGNWEDHFEEPYILKLDADFGFQRHKTLAVVGLRF